MLQSLAVISAICVLTIRAGWALQAALERVFRDRRQKQTLKTVLNLGTRLVRFSAWLLQD